MRIPVVIQYRHVHLCKRDYHTLFGEEKPTVLRTLSHHEQVVLQDTVDIETKTGVLNHVRILGPTRAETQVELSATDAAALKLHAPLRVSGDMTHGASCTLRGPCGVVRAQRCVIIPARHVHLNPNSAKQLNISHGQLISLVLGKETQEKMDHVTVRVHPTFMNEFHLTTDEAAEFWLQSGDFVEI